MEFVFVSVLLTMLFLGVLQVACYIHVRNVLIDCAGAGARYAAISGNTDADGIARAKELITQDVSASYAKKVTAARETRDGVQLVVVQVDAPTPILGLWGIAEGISAQGHAVVEQ